MSKKDVLQQVELMFAKTKGKLDDADVAIGIVRMKWPEKYGADATGLDFNWDEMKVLTQAKLDSLQAAKESSSDDDNDDSDDDSDSDEEEEEGSESDGDEDEDEEDDSMSSESAESQGEDPTIAVKTPPTAGTGKKQGGASTKVATTTGPPTSDWDSPERVKKRLIKFRDRLTRFYQQYAPEKLEKIETDLDIFEHRESELMVKLIKQYGKEPEEPLNSSDDEPYVSPWTAENPRPRLDEGSRARRARQKRGGGDRTTEEKEAEKQRGDRRTMKLKQRDERKAGGGRLPKDPREEAEACPLDFGPTRYDLPEEEAKTLLKKFGVQ